MTRSLEIRFNEMPVRQEGFKYCPTCRKTTLQVTVNGVRRCEACNSFFSRVILHDSVTCPFCRRTFPLPTGEMFKHNLAIACPCGNVIAIRDVVE